jgi:NTP pyrophosphatase (non-canonical NTP hydrolase)
MSNDHYAPDAIQRQALRTWHNNEVPLREQRLHALLGLAGETGELVDVLKKHFYKPGYEAAPETVKDELSDVLYYVAVLSHLWGFTFDDMAAHLAVKLAGGHGWDGSGAKIAAQLAAEARAGDGG